MSKADDLEVQLRALRFAFTSLLRALAKAAPELETAFAAELRQVSADLDASDFPHQAEVLRGLMPTRE